MAKAVAKVGQIVGTIATIASFIPGPHQSIAATIAVIANTTAAVAQIGASALQKPPPARGSITEAIIEIDPPSPYAMGEGYFAGVKRHHAGYGATLDKVPNPYLWEVYALSTGGPIEGPITPQFDFKAVTGFYTDFFKHDTKLGAVPDTALASGYGSASGWGADYKLSGTAAIGFNHLFDKKGKRYASGLPTRGVLAKWVKVYDPRKDDTFPGGAGTHRLGVESTYEWSESPALHAGTYAYGRYQNAKRVFGMGLPVEAIDFEAIAAWANDCEANSWRMFGVIFEGAGITPGQRWQNLRDICIAGGAEPLPLYTGIGFHWDRPRVVLDTITEADCAGEIDATGMQSYRDRINTIVAEWMMEDQNWQVLPGIPIVGITYLAEDGEPNTAVFPFNFVKDAQQAGQLAAYKLANGREIYPVSIDLMPRLRAYRPGDCLYLDIPAAGLDTPAVMLTRQVDPATGSIKAVFIGETAAKHAYALGETAVPPPTPYIGMSAQERDELAAAANSDSSASRRIVTRTVPFPVSSDATSITIVTFEGVLDDGRTVVFPAGSITGLANATTFAVLYDLIAEAYIAAPLPATAELADSDNAFVFWQATSNPDGTYVPPPTSPPGYNGGGDPNYQTP